MREILEVLGYYWYLSFIGPIPADETTKKTHKLGEFAEHNVGEGGIYPGRWTW